MRNLLPFASLLLAGCGVGFHDMGPPPQLTPPALSGVNDHIMLRPEPRIVRLDDRYNMASTSIWSDSGGQLFRDARAFRAGDILTIRISMDDRAELLNRSNRDTKASGSVTAGATLLIDDLAPEQSLEANGNLAGTLSRGGTVNRSEKIELSIAAAVVEASPNGNLLVRGSQEIRVNHEMRVLEVEGVVRTRDILPDNTIPYDKIAEARISYGGANSRPRVEPMPQYGFTQRQ